jgi:hypothetical protein
MKQISRRWRFHEGYWAVLMAAIGGILCPYIAQAGQAACRGPDFPGVDVRRDVVFKGVKDRLCKPSSVF